METIEKYLSRLPKKTLSDVKIKILTRLWSDDNDSFPKPWVSSTELLALTGQKYFDRRTRELRDQLGCDIETQYLPCFSGHGWRLNSNSISSPLDRDYLTISQKNAIFSNCDSTCAVCGKKTPPGVRGLQADHKIPVSRGGSNDLFNWQALCHNCNVGKRRACDQCNLDCNKCSWAYPDINGITSMVSIKEENLRKIKSLSMDENITIDQIINQAIENI